MRFTTRPELSGTFGMVTSTHWIASQVGMKMLEAGGNAFDAAVAMGFTLHMAEPHLCGPLGDMPLLIRPAGADRPTVICGQGTAPAGATIEHYKDQGLDLIPGSGLLATVIPGAFDAWMLLLRDHGTMSLREVLEPAIHYANHGIPMLPGASKVIDGLAEFFREEWPSSAVVWMPTGDAPAPGALFANPDLGHTWARLLSEAEAAGGDRESQIEAARTTFKTGFIAQTIDDWMATAEVMDATGHRRRGVLRGDDMANWEATYEDPLDIDYEGWTVWKAGPWSQSPSLLQSLRILEGSGIAEADPEGDTFVHLVTEAMKLAFADREAYYGDPLHADIPMETLLSRAYADERRALISETASLDQRPGRIEGLEAQAEAFIARAAAQEGKERPGEGEPTMAHLADRKGDTVHIDVVDRWGNMVSATPSGGWLQSSPVVPGLGMPLNSRAQMFWLDPGLPTSLAPGRRPRTTLSPSMAQRPDGRALAFGTPGGDQQDQWQLSFLLRLIHGDINLQEAIDGPLFQTAHLQASFFPRGTKPGHLLVEPGFDPTVIEALKARGHRLEVSAPWALGRLTAVDRAPDGLLRAGATPRLMQAYAVGR